MFGTCSMRVRRFSWRIVAPGHHGLRHRAAQRFKREWTAENFAWDYERVVTKALNAYQSKQGLVAYPPQTAGSGAPAEGGAEAGRHFAKATARLERKGSDRGSRQPREWISTAGSRAAASGLAVPPSGERRYNRILDDAARRMYAPMISFLHSIAPEIMAREIEAANVQQAFVFDAAGSLCRTAPRFCASAVSRTPLSCSQGDGGRVEEIDPVTNFDLDEFVERPSTARESYDVVFATSVLEHVEDDEKFMRPASEMLKPGR